jgi:sugar lactone lactonase YvrE
MKKKLLWCLICAAVVVCAGCSVRNYKVLDSITDQPLSGAKARVTISGHLPGLGHSPSFILREWNLESDANGEFWISFPWADEADVRDLSKDGYSNAPTAKEQRLRRSSHTGFTYLYLTPNPEETMERLRFILQSNEYELHMAYRFHYLPTGLIPNYAHAKAIAKTQRERTFLREFCQFTNDVRAISDENRLSGEDKQRAEELLADCSAPRNDNADGVGAAARFNRPQGVATDRAGNVYVADTSNHTIRKITPAGVVTTLAGTAGSSGSTDATGAAARFNRPQSLATDSAGNVYVADYYNTTIRKITPAGMVSTLAGTAGFSLATRAAQRFSAVTSVATDSAGNVYVAEYYGNTISKVTPTGAVSTLAGPVNRATGSTDGTGAGARFNWPHGVATDRAGNVYVADTSNHTIRKITSAGGVTTLAGMAGLIGSTDATGAAARFYFPAHIASDSAGNLYVADNGNHTIRKITPAGVVSTLAGTASLMGSTDATGAAARFYYLEGVATDIAGNVYVADSGNHTIRKITPAGVVTTLAGTAGLTGPTQPNRGKP